MKNSFLFVLFSLPFFVFAQEPSSKEIGDWVKQAQRVEIIRDKWGIAHVYGKTDADAVFGMLYAQCEDDFKRIELNYIEKLGRLSEIEGEKMLYNDLQIRLLIDSTQAINDYKKAEPWMKKLLEAYADGINFYLYKNPRVKPALLTKFKPWYPFLWTDGSIGAISTGNLTIAELKKFYTNDHSVTGYIPQIRDQFSGSNGFAFAPKVSKTGNAMLYINPHTTFYFRPEIHMQSEEGLNTYGAVTWGQFFIYQGFNEFCGWMHTSNNVDVADMYAEKITRLNKTIYYTFDKKLYPIEKKNIEIKYLENGLLKTKKFETYFTHNGPIMASRDGKWISLKHRNQNPQSLVQSWVRTKSKSFEDYQKAMDLTANASNNTVYADAKGNIAYWHGNFIPKRDTAYNWSEPVDATTSATAWQGLHPVSESVHIYNPANGWLQNCNSTPFTAAGANSPKKADYPAYMAPDGENFRGVAALKLLNQPNKYDLDGVIALGYNTYLPAFEVLLPALIKAYDQLPAENTLKASLKEPIAELKKWDYYSSTTSVAATLAMEWAPRLSRDIQNVYVDQGEKDQVEKTLAFVKVAKAEALLQPLKLTIDDLNKRFGKWQMPWGEVNRFQRSTGAISEKYNDAAPSFPVAFGSAIWGQLPSYRSNQFNTNKRYGYSGNSFVCAVEFGTKIKAKSILAGGNSGDPKSKHFNDQAEMYSKGELKDVLFYKEDILNNMERTYKPGEL
ncbi:penicillin acylase family protein [Pedobacter ureilyticus]|uniref:Penicillin acylase family protein n=1 Tax=Pedobacter ureilyticus TaxID=1393051 RepID=A0ABW9J4C5_9SPHI|nr:penicillin acylase family protein [Pedobacter helvus]